MIEEEVPFCRKEGKKNKTWKNALRPKKEKKRN